MLLGIACFLTYSTPAESWQQYGLSSSLVIVGADQLGEPARTFQMYREQTTHVEIAFGLGNAGENAFYFNSGIIERGIRLRMFSMDETTGQAWEMAVGVTPRGILEADGSGPFITFPDQLVLTEQGDSVFEGRRSLVVWIVAVTQPDGRPFVPGRYRFETENRDIRSAIVPASGERLPDTALTGWSRGTKGEFDLVITAPTTPAQVALMYRQQGDVALERRQFEDAATLFRQAVDANPSDQGTAPQRLSMTYLNLGRYADALPVLKRMPLRAQGLVEAYLAEAYVGLGNEAEAISLLRRGGWAEAEVGAQIQSLRDITRQRLRR